MFNSPPRISPCAPRALAASWLFTTILSAIFTLIRALFGNVTVHSPLPASLNLPFGKASCNSRKTSSLLRCAAGSVVALYCVFPAASVMPSSASISASRFCAASSSSRYLNGSAISFCTAFNSFSEVSILRCALSKVLSGACITACSMLPSVASQV